MKRTQAELILKKATIDPSVRVCVLGIRGYFDPEAGNVRGIYDDALFIVTPDFYHTYNANTDPSRAFAGVAVLQTGIYYYVKGLHGVSGKHPYFALRQDSNVVVKRDGSVELKTDSPNARFYIDIHRGGFNTTSSLGCQTIHPNQWDHFRDNIFEQMLRHKQPRIPYILVEQSVEPALKTG